MQATKTRGLCRTERRETRWLFSGWATATAAENTVRPRGYYRTCLSCTSFVLTLADVDDGEGFCKAILNDWLRRAGGAADKIDADNVLGDLFAHLWHLYNKWLPGGLTFTSYASGIMRKKINTFVARDVGDPTDKGRGPKAHSRTTSQSYEVLTRGYTDSSTATGAEDSPSNGGRGSLDFSLGVVAQDPTGDHAASGCWVDAARDRGASVAEAGGSVTSQSSSTT